MNKIDIEKLEELNREIIVALEEDFPEDKSGLMCAESPRSPFRQLIGLLEMEMAAARIMYSEEPYVPDPEIEELPAKKPEESQHKPVQEASAVKSERPTIREAATAPAKPRESVNFEQKQNSPKELRAVHLADSTVVSPRSVNISEPRAPGRFKPLLIATGFLLAFVIGYLIANRPTQPETSARITVNWSDVEKGKTATKNLNDKISPQQKKAARSFYTLGKSELSKNNLRSAREYFRSAVSADPSNQEYMEVYRQTDHDVRKIKKN